MSAPAAFTLGLGLGLWVAALAWIWRYAWGYRAGVAFCTKELAFGLELRNEFEGALGPTSVLRHHVSEEMRLRMQAAAEEPKETRH
jgi:hypothetical protein